MEEKMKFATLYGPHLRVRLDFGEELSRTKQSFKDECDINNIVRKAEKNGFFPPPSLPPQFGDYSDPSDYQTAMNTVLAAKAQFESLPARVRARFVNDPAAYLAFVSDPQNIDEMVKLGLATKRPAADPPTAPEPVQPPKKPAKKPPTEPVGED